MNEYKNQKYFFSIIIPTYNEEKNIKKTVVNIANVFAENEVKDYEIFVVNDPGNDNTENILKDLEESIIQFRYLNNEYGKGFGNSLSFAIENCEAKNFCVVMADSSENPAQIYSYYRHFKTESCSIWGSRFIKGSEINGHPLIKFIFNRLFNNILRLISFNSYNDFTNSFKGFSRKEVLEFLPLKSKGFEFMTELTLKMILRGSKFKVIPISWKDQRVGGGNFKILNQVIPYLLAVKHALFG